MKTCTSLLFTTEGQAQLPDIARLDLRIMLEVAERGGCGPRGARLTRVKLARYLGAELASVGVACGRLRKRGYMVCDEDGRYRLNPAFVTLPAGDPDGSLMALYLEGVSYAATRPKNGGLEAQALRAARAAERACAG